VEFVESCGELYKNREELTADFTDHTDQLENFTKSGAIAAVFFKIKTQPKLRLSGFNFYPRQSEFIRGEKLIPDAIHERPQLARARRMPQLAQRLGFDLPDAFAGHGE